MDRQIDGNIDRQKGKDRLTERGSIAEGQRQIDRLIDRQTEGSHKYTDTQKTDK